jgi:hypothetical protein
MKIRNPLTQLSCVYCLCAVAQVAYSQGSLTPSGAPGPSMKSLDQIEPRTPISYAPFAISNPGSYYLTTNLVGSSGFNGISIYSGNVTLDLNGFTLQGVTSSHSGVYVEGYFNNITIKNGIINDWGVNGIDVYSAGATPIGVVCKDLTVSANVNDGISIANGCTVSDCSLINNYGDGIYLIGSNSRVVGNTIVGNDAGNSATAGGIYVAGSNNRIEDNHITQSSPAGYGIYVGGGNVNNIIIKNSVVGEGANSYSIGANNDLGPVGTAATSASPWANFQH